MPARTEAELIVLRDVLRRLRTKLLEGSSRNSLLNFRHSVAKSVRLVNDAPSRMFEALANGRELRILPVERWPEEEGAQTLDLPLFASAEIDAAERELRAEPSSDRAREVARKWGINTSWELSESLDRSSPECSELQTLLFPGDLEAVLRRMDQEAKLCVNETGANFLHLIFGFVDWGEPGNGPPVTLRTAPLLVVPVQLRRGESAWHAGARSYSLRSTGEAWSTNATLVEKLRNDFELSLPVIAEDEALPAYFSRVEAALERSGGIAKLSRRVSLGLVSFGKELLFRDLDPSGPFAARVLGHDLVRRLVLRRPDGDDGGPAGVPALQHFRIDEPASVPVPLPPLVMDADSSQHAVLIDVEAEKSLVVRGPPGTGKSQTIANLIASRLRAGKKVLFVAEKRAALDVVLRRLEQVGLGEFCLAVHGTQSQKAELLKSLQLRMDLSTPAPEDAQQAAKKRAALDAARSRLNSYVTRLHAIDPTTGLSPFRLLGRARRAADKLPEEVARAVRELRLADARQLDADRVTRATALVAEYARCVEDAGLSAATNIEALPWRGVRRADLAHENLEQAVDLAKRWRERLEVASTRREDEERSTGTTLPASLREATRALDALRVCEPGDSLVRSDAARVVEQAPDSEPLAAAVALRLEAERLWAAQPDGWQAVRGWSDARWQSMTARVEEAAERFGGGFTRLELRAARVELLGQAENLRRAGALADEVCGTLGVSGRLELRATLALLASVGRVVSLPAEALAFRSDALTSGTASSELDRLESTAAELKAASTAAAAPFVVGGQPSEDAARADLQALVGAPAVFPWLFSGSYRAALSRFRLAVGRRAARPAAEQELRACVAAQAAAREFGRAVGLLAMFGSRAAGVESPFANARRVLEWRRECEAAVRGLDTSTAQGLLRTLWSADAASLTAASERVAQAMPFVAPLLEASSRAPGDGALVTARLGHAGAIEWRSALKELERDCEVVEAFERDVDPTCGAADHPLRQLSASCRDVEHARAADRSSLVSAAPIRAAGRDPARSDEVHELHEALAYVGGLREGGLQPSLVAWLCATDVTTRHALAVASLERTTSSSREADEVGRRFASLVELDAAGWCSEFVAGCTDLSSMTDGQLKDRIARALEHEGSLAKTAAFLRARRAAAQVGGEPICTLVEAGAIPASTAGMAFAAVAYGSLASTLLGADQALDHFAGATHDELRRSFQRLDLEAQEVAAESVRRTLLAVDRVSGVRSGPVAGFQDEGLIRHFADRPRGRITTRGIFERAADAILALKPCFLMSPRAIAQFLSPGRYEFDLVVMDEASQIRPEDALGAIARGRQVVVVGDPRQLGPTTFFDAAMGNVGDEEDEWPVPGPDAAPVTGPTEIEKAESILVAAEAILPTRTLTWHYRSRHPKLIAFSNKEFYQSSLTIFPTPDAQASTDGVHLHRVSDARYVGRRNRLEAEAVVAAVCTHAKTHPKKSLLIATLNRPQADLIDELLDHAERTEPELAAFRARWDATLEPLVVKNLENVQGDERDTVFVSLTFGPNETGVFHLNFGPINGTDGARRLNVLFTRAKHNVEVFCSFEPSELTRSTATGAARVSGGLAVLARYLEYARSDQWLGGVSETREFQSDFEESVALALERRGHRVHAQVGVHGYFIDLGVVHPTRPKTYVLGVECDGETYHSAASARDRDRLRQKVLEQYGWRIHRVWSTDWFRDPRGETAKIEAAIRTIVG